MRVGQALFGLVLGWASCAFAQTAPSPADVGITHGNPDVFKLLDSSKTWVPFGSVDPTTNIFTPVGGGGGGSSNLTIYSTHSGLVNLVTTPTGAWTIVQQGFYAAGDGGQATYQWNPASFCAGATSGADAPSAGDGFLCVLPGGQNRNTAGRYLLQMNNGAINVKQLGFKDDGTDNGPLVQRLNDALATFGSRTNYGLHGPTIVFAGDANSIQSNYWFNSPLWISHNSTVVCNDGSRVANEPRVNLVFGPGTGGVRAYSNEIDTGGNDHFNINGCGIVLQGGGWIASPTGGSNVIPNTAMPVSPIVRFGAKQPDPKWSVGDGIAIFQQDSYWFFTGYIVNDILTVTVFSSGWSTTDPGIATGQLFRNVPGLPHGIYIRNTHAEEPAMTGTGHEGTYRISNDIRTPPVPAEAIASGLFASAGAPVSMTTGVQSGDANVPMGTTVTGCSSLSGTLCTASTGTLTLSGPARIGEQGASFNFPGPNTTQAEGDQSFKVTTSSTGKNYGPITGSISGTTLTVTGGAGSLKVGQRIIGGYGGFASTTATGALTVGQTSIPVASCTGIFAGSYVIAFNGGAQVLQPQTTASCVGTTLTLDPRFPSTNVFETTSGSNVIQADDVAYFNRWQAWKGTAVSGPGIPAGTVVVSMKTAPWNPNVMFVTVSNPATVTAAGVTLTFGGVVAAAPSGTTLYFVGGASDRLIVSYGTGTGGNGTYILEQATTELPSSQLFAYDTPGTIYISGGPRLPFPQELLWIDGFPFGVIAAKVFTRSLTTQTDITVITSDTSSYYEVPGFADHPAGSGKMWLFPAGLFRGAQGNSFGNEIYGFGVGINMACAATNYSPPIGCGRSHDSENSLFYNVVGRLVVGNNSGGSASTFNEYDHNEVADVVELGSVGSTYLGEMLQGEDESSNTHVLISGCFTGTTMIGAYASGADDEPTCMVPRNAILSAQPSAFTQGNAPPWVAPIYSVPFMSPIGASIFRPATTCSGAPTVAFKVTNGIVTHC